ncbi:MAG: hypothetical protein WBV73_22270 [Phormidium sp.]
MTDANHANGNLFYYADGKKIPLNPSRHFVAVQTDIKNLKLMQKLQEIPQELSEDPIQDT